MGERSAIARPVGVASLVISLAVATTTSAQPPGACTTPVRERTSDVGCYLTGTQSLGALPDRPLFWHLYVYPTLAAAETSRGPRGTVVESLGKIWLYTIAESEWRPSTGERIAVIGPFHIDTSKQYTARYMEATFTPGMETRPHRHSGPEAWYLVSGGQCLETPSGITVARAAQSAVVPEGPPMLLKSVGAETRRSVLLVLHDSSRPWISIENDWKPTGSCPK